jgi:HEPN domain-containing protein
MRRPHDWFRQAELDLAAARDAHHDGHHEWACFAAQQSAEKAVKALHESVGVEAWGHSVSELLTALPDVPGDLVVAAKALDKHYIPARYPNAHPAGAPGELYTAPEAERALADAERIVEHVQRRLPSSRS